MTTSANAAPEPVRLGRWLLLAAVLAAYWPVLSCGFIWDDYDNIVNNHLLASMQGLWKLWTDPSSFHQYYPLTISVFWLEKRIFGLNPTGFHFVNLLVHAWVVLLVWRVLAKLRVRGAWLIALIFAIHPLQVETVAWITEMKNLLSTALYLVAAWYFLEYMDDAEKDRSGADRLPWATNRSWRASFLFFALALVSKSVATLLPAALTLIVWWKRGRIEREAIHALLPFFITSLAFGIFAILIEYHSVGAGTVDWGLSLLDRVLLSGRVSWTYIFNILWPGERSFFYPNWEINPGAFRDWLWWPAMAAFAGALWFLRGWTGRGPLTALLFYLVTIFPVMGFLRVYGMKFSYVADHFQYLAGIGIVCLAVSLLLRLFDRVSGSAARFLPLGLTLCLALALAATSMARVPVFESNGTLWADTLAKNPDSPIANKNLAGWLFDLKRYGEAAGYAKRAVQLDPADADSFITLGATLDRLGDAAGALEAFDKAAVLAPDLPTPRLNACLIYSRLGKTAESEKCFAEAASKWPFDPFIEFEWGGLSARTGDREAASRHFERALDLAPDFTAARAALARLGGVRRPR